VGHHSIEWVVSPLDGGHHPHHHPRRVEDTRVVAPIDRVDDVDVDVDGRECATRERRGASTMRNAWNRCRRRARKESRGGRGGGRRDRTGRAGTLNVENLNLDWMAYDSKGFARESAVWVVRAT